MRDTDCIVSPGLDESFRWALNYLLLHNRNALAQVRYTVGPLCILKWPVPIAHNIAISTIFYFFTGWLFTYMYTSFYSRMRSTFQLVVPLLACAVLLLIVSVDVALLGCIILAILNFRFLDDRKYIVVAVLITVCGMYLKTSLFVLFACIWASFIIYLLFSRQYLYVLRLLVVGVALYLLSGLLLLGSVSGLISFTQHNVGFAVQYSDLLSIYPYNNPKYLTGCVLCLVIIFILFRRQPGGFLMGLTGLALFATWKYSLGREDIYHALMFAYLLILLTILFLATQQRRIHSGMLLLLVAVCCYSSNLQYTPAYTDKYFWLPSFVNFNARVLHPHRFKEQIGAETKSDCAPNILPAAWQNVIDKNTVDVFPWDLSIVMINNLNYLPRPSLQSIGLNADNDLADAATFSAAAAPTYLIWHTTPGPNTSIDGLDEQYIPNTCAATTEAIIANYHLTSFTNDRLAVWAKRPVPTPVQKHDAGSLTTSWGLWVTLPAHDSGNIIKGYIDYDNTLLFSLRNFFYKGSPVFIDYETDSGKVMHYRFSKQCGHDGLFLTPLWIDNQGHTVNIKRVRFTTEVPDYFSKDVRIGLQQITIAGK